MAGWGRRFRIAIQGKDPRATVPAAGRSSGISSRPGPAAAPRRPATAGPAPASGRPPAGSSSAASKSPRCAFRCSSRRHEFRPDSGGAGQYRGGPGGIVEMVVETAEPALGNTAGDGVRHGACGILGGEDGAAAPLHALFRQRRAARDQDQGNRPRRSAPATGWCSNPAAAAAGATRRGPGRNRHRKRSRDRVRDADAPSPACGGGTVRALLRRITARKQWTGC